jgi:hypothetical protein
LKGRIEDLFQEVGELQHETGTFGEDLAANGKEIAELKAGHSDLKEQLLLGLSAGHKPGPA